MKCIRFSLKHEGEEIARARLYLLHNDLHEAPFGFIEDVFVVESFRGQGYGKKLYEMILARAKKEGCYKVLACSRFGKEDVHKFIERQGFKQHGYCFRLEQKSS